MVHHVRAQLGEVMRTNVRDGISSRIGLTIFLVLFGVASSLQGQSASAEAGWSGNLSLNNYIFADDYILNPILQASHDHFHLEGRYNYEDLQTLSLLGGYTLRLGEEWKFEATPMLGFSFGKTTAILPAAELRLSRGKFERYAEAEALFDYTEADANFFYAWTEFNVYPLDWLSVGILATRTRLFGNDLDIQRGLSVGCYPGNFSLYGSFMNFGLGDAYGYLAAGYTIE